MLIKATHEKRRESLFESLYSASSSLFFLGGGGMPYNLIDLNLLSQGLTSSSLLFPIVGVATSSQTPTSSYENLIHQVDKAVYKVKEQGQNQV